MEILKEIVFVMSSEEEKNLEIQSNKKIIDMYMAMKDIKKFMQKVNEEKKKKIITALIKGIKKGKDFNGTQDYSPSNHLVLSNNKEYHGKTENEEFYRILNELLGEDYSNIIQKY